MVTIRLEGLRPLIIVLHHAMIVIDDYFCVAWGLHRKARGKYADEMGRRTWRD